VIWGVIRGSYCGRRDISVANTAAILNGGVTSGSGRRFAAVAGVGSYGRFAAKRSSGVYLQPAVVEVALACELASMTARIGTDRGHEAVAHPCDDSSYWEGQGT